MNRKTAKERAEIAEYTSLIRSLHTTSTQDALPHLLVPTSVSAPFFSSSRAPSPARQTIPFETPMSPSSPTSLSDEDTQVKVIRSDLGGKDNSVIRNESREGDVPSGGRRFDLIEGSQEKRKGRSTWTRWPLLKGDVYIPEWTLQDEVQILASKATREWINTYATTGSDTRQDPTDQVATEDSPAGGSSLESTMLHPGVIGGLTLEAENILARIFGALAAQWPLVDKSLQDRLRPMDGRAVLEIVGQAGIVNPEIILRVQHRLEAEKASPSTDFHPAHLDPAMLSLPLATLTRSEALQTRRRKVADLEEELGEDPFNFIDDPYQKKGTRKPRRKGSTAQMEDV